jgi:hypothetical protein
MVKKTSQADGGAVPDVETAVAKALASLGRGLALPDRPFESVRYQTGRMSLRFSNHLVEGSLSAPRSLVGEVWGDIPGVTDRVWAVSAGRWDAVRTCLQCDDAVQADWLTLAESLRRAGNIEEAQLTWLQAEDFATAQRRSPRFKQLFPTLSEVQQLNAASSAAAFIKRLLHHVDAASVVDRFIVARDLLDHLWEAYNDVEGKRQAQLVEEVEAGLAALDKQSEPCIRELSRLVRSQWRALRE